MISVTRSVLSVAAIFFAVLSPSAWSFEYQKRIINGQPVAAGEYKEVVQMTSQGYPCTATVVGPRVLLTAAHCADQGKTAEFKVNGQTYTGTIYRSPLFPSQQKDHDIAVAITNSDISGVTPATVGGTPTRGLGVTILGFGCTQPEARDFRPDDTLRKGETEIVDVKPMYFVSRKTGGAAVCFGDSGGPAFVQNGNKRQLLGVHFKGNIQDTNYDVRNDVAETQTFLKDIATSKSVEICGINKNCDGSQPTAPSCALSAIPSSVNVGQSLTLKMAITGTATSATIQGANVSVTNPELSITPSTAGTFSAQATVTGAGGTGTCSASYTVTSVVVDPAPSCTLSANPSSIKLGESLTLRMSVTGKANSASIQGANVSLNNPEITITPSVVGNWTAQASVTGPGGTGSCMTSYVVNNNNPDPPPSCSLTAVPSTVTLGQSLTLRMSITGNATSASILGANVAVGNPQVNITPSAIGSFTAQASVTGPTGTGSCMTSYVVNNNNPDPAPTCSLALSASSITLGQKITATISVSGKATSAAIEGQAVPMPMGSYTWEPKWPGSQVATGSVIGPGGSNTCKASFTVNGENPNIPNYAVTPTHCGANVITENPVKQVCLALIKYSYAKRDLAIKEAVLIELVDGSHQVVPIINRKGKPNPSGDPETVEELSLYANGLSQYLGQMVLDVRTATLTSSSSGEPLSIQGKTANVGAVSYQYLVESLKRLP